MTVIHRPSSIFISDHRPHRPSNVSSDIAFAIDSPLPTSDLQPSQASQQRLYFACRRAVKILRTLLADLLNQRRRPYNLSCHMGSTLPSWRLDKCQLEYV